MYVVMRDDYRLVGNDCLTGNINHVDIFKAKIFKSFWSAFWTKIWFGERKGYILKVCEPLYTYNFDSVQERWTDNILLYDESTELFISAKYYINSEAIDLRINPKKVFVVYSKLHINTGNEIKDIPLNKFHYISPKRVSLYDYVMEKIQW